MTEVIVVTTVVNIILVVMVMVLKHKVNKLRSEANLYKTAFSIAAARCVEMIEVNKEAIDIAHRYNTLYDDMSYIPGEEYDYH